MVRLLLALLLFAFVVLNKYLFEWKSIPVLIIKVLFLYIFIYGIIEYFDIYPIIKKFLIDILMGVLVLSQTQRVRYKFPGIEFFAVFTGILFLSMLFSFSSLYSTFTYFRTFLYPYLVFIVIFNLSLSGNEWNRFNQFILSLYILQIIASLMKFFFFGVSEKIIIGTVSISGGNFSTTIPLTAIAFVFAFFLIFKPNLKKILLITGFLFMAFVGAKRAIWIFTPLILLLATFFYGRIKKEPISGTKKKGIVGINLSIILLSFLIIAFGAKYSRTLNPEKRVGGQIDLKYLHEYALDYTFATSPDEQYTRGRGANFLSVTSQILKQFSINSLFGFGPEAAKGVRSYGAGIWSKLNVDGPVTGLTYHLVQIGLVGALFIVFVILKLSLLFFKLSKIESNKFWKAFSFGTFLITIVFLIDILTYSTSFIATIFPLSFTFAYLAALVLKRKYYLENKLLKAVDKPLSPNQIIKKEAMQYSESQIYL